MTLQETIIEDLIKRVERLENNQNQKEPIWKTNPTKPATENQLIYLANQGINTDNIKTQKDVTEAFNLLNTRQNKQFSSNISNSAEPPIVQERELNNDEEDKDLFPDY